jgi:hypothetical protein
MEITLNIPFTDLLSVVQNLTPAQRALLQTELATQPKTTSSKERLKKLLLNGPKLTGKQLKTIQQTRKEINQWRTKS